MDIAKDLRELEEMLLDGSIRKNAGTVASLLTDDFEEFGSSGQTFNKQQIIQELQLEASSELSLQDFRVDLLSDCIALVTYRSRRVEAGIPEKMALRSSVWILKDRRWQLRFHQGTRIQSQGYDPLQL